MNAKGPWTRGLGGQPGARDGTSSPTRSGQVTRLLNPKPPIFAFPLQAPTCCASASFTAPGGGGETKAPKPPASL